MTMVNTGNEIINCRDCGTNVRYVLDEQWGYNEDTKAGFHIAFTNLAPRYCPVCASENIELSDEQVSQWEFAARTVGVPPSPETIEMIEELYKTAWDSTSGQSFIDFLKDVLN